MSFSRILKWFSLGNVWTCERINGANLRWWRVKWQKDDLWRSQPFLHVVSMFVLCSVVWRPNDTRSCSVERSWSETVFRSHLVLAGSSLNRLQSFSCPPANIRKIDCWKTAATAELDPLPNKAQGRRRSSHQRKMQTRSHTHAKEPCGRFDFAWTRGKNPVNLGKDRHQQLQWAEPGAPESRSPGAPEPGPGAPDSRSPRAWSWSLIWIGRTQWSKIWKI